MDILQPYYAYILILWLLGYQPITVSRYSEIFYKKSGPVLKVNIVCTIIYQFTRPDFTIIHILAEWWLGCCGVRSTIFKPSVFKTLITRLKCDPGWYRTPHTPTFPISNHSTTPTSYLIKSSKSQFSGIVESMNLI